jgi:hypothetical protein
MRARASASLPVLISVLLHGALLLGGIKASQRPRAVDSPERDVWAGRTLSVEAALETAPAAQPASPVAPVLPAAPDTAPGRPARAIPASDPQGSPAKTVPRQRASAALPRSAARARAAAEFGSEGLAPGVRRLALAFTRAVPAATSRDPVWSGLPLGAAGQLRVAITLDDEGRIAKSEVQSGPRPDPHLERLLSRTLLLLARGRFALSRQATSARTEFLGVEVRVSMLEPTEGFEPTHPVRLGFDPPSAARRGRAYFTLASGRHVETWISVE